MTYYPTAFLDKEGVILEVDELFHKALGYQPLAMAGKPFGSVFQRTDGKGLDLSEMLCEVSATKSNGSSETFLAVISPILDQMLEVHRYRICLAQISSIPSIAVKMQQVESRIEESERELRSFVSCVSHDIKSPILNIKGFSTELLDQIEGMKALIEENREKFPDYQELLGEHHDGIVEAVRYIESSAERVDRLVNCVVTIHRLGMTPLVCQRVDLNQLFGSITAPIRHRLEKSNCELRIDPHLPTINADRTLMERIFVNFLDNAVKYLDPSRRGVVAVSYEEKNDEMVFRIKDNGVGIAQANFDKVFAMFRRAHDLDIPGYGVGMPMVKAMLNLLEGRVWFNSAEGKGTTFYLSLPLAMKA